MYLGLIELYGLISFVKQVFRYDCNNTNSKKKFFKYNCDLKVTTKGIFSHLTIRRCQSGDQLLPNACDDVNLCSKKKSGHRGHMEYIFPPDDYTQCDLLSKTIVLLFRILCKCAMIPAWAFHLLVYP